MGFEYGILGRLRCGLKIGVGRAVGPDGSKVSSEKDVTENLGRRTWSPSGTGCRVSSLSVSLLGYVTDVFRWLVK